MDTLRPPTFRREVVVNPNGVAVGDPDFNLVGRGDSLSRQRMLTAPGLAQGVSVFQRYYPTHPPTESCYFGLDFSALIPFGGGIEAASLSIFVNNVTRDEADVWWRKGPMEVHGRQVRAILTGGQRNVDYRLVWTVTDWAQNIWPRTTLVLCGDTS